MTEPPGPPHDAPPYRTPQPTAFDPSFGEGPPGPLYLPAGPPGTMYGEAGGGTPAAVFWFRLYAGLITLQFLGLAVFGVSGAITAGFKGGKPGVDDLVVGAVISIVGLGLSIPHLVVLFSGRRPWVHTMGTVLLALGIIGGGCCAIPAIALLISWTSQETKRWFDVT